MDKSSSHTTGSSDTDSRLPPGVEASNEKSRELPLDRLFAECTDHLRQVAKSLPDAEAIELCSIAEYIDDSRLRLQIWGSDLRAYLPKDPTYNDILSVKNSVHSRSMEHSLKMFDHNFELIRQTLNDLADCNNNEQ